MATGYRGLLAPWIGGAAKPAASPVAGAGYRGMLAFWAGGAANSGDAPPPQPQLRADGSSSMYWRKKRIVRQNAAVIALVAALCEVLK